MRLRSVAPGVRVATARRWSTTTTVVLTGSECLVVDPALTRDELAGLAGELTGLRVVAGFSTHPHWDHLLWESRWGVVPRWAVPEAVTRVERDRELLLGQARAELGDDGVDASVFAQVTALDGLGATTAADGGEGLAGGGDGPTAGGPTRVRAGGPLPSWPDAVVVPYRAHAPGSAALVTRGVMVAGDVLSDREVPLLDPEDPDPIGSYLGALDTLEAAARDLGVRVLVPGHGTVTDAGGLAERLAADRAYLEALRDGRAVADLRLADPEVARDHAAQAALIGRAGA